MTVAGINIGKVTKRKMPNKEQKNPECLDCGITYLTSHMRNGGEWVKNCQKKEGKKHRFKEQEKCECDCHTAPVDRPYCPMTSCEHCRSTPTESTAEGNISIGHPDKHYLARNFSSPTKCCDKCLGDLGINTAGRACMSFICECHQFPLASPTKPEVITGVSKKSEEWEKSKWCVLEDDHCIHVVPETDSKPHGFPKGDKADLADSDCSCKPRIDFGGKKPLVIHNSFDDMKKVNDSMNKLEAADNWESDFDKKFSQNSDNEACTGWLAMKNGIFHKGKECTKIANPDDVKSFIRQEKEKSYQEGLDDGKNVAEARHEEDCESHRPGIMSIGCDCQWENCSGGKYCSKHSLENKPVNEVLTMTLEEFRKIRDEARHSAYSEINKIIDLGIKRLEGLKKSGEDNWVFKGGIAALQDLKTTLKERIK